jgi:hypothetical protein
MDGSVKRLLGIGLAILVVIGIFVGGVFLIGGRGSTGANASPTPTGPKVATISCIGGSEKTGLMADPKVQSILRKKYNLEVQFVPMGSYDQVLLTSADLKKRAADCLWPSSASAQYVFEATHQTTDYKAYRARTVLQSPEVIYAGPDSTAALVKTGIVQERSSNRYYIVDLKRLLTDYVQKGASWSSLGTSVLAGPVMISSTDPAKSNSGFTLYQLMLTMLSTNNVYDAPTVVQAKLHLKQLRAIYDQQGLQARSSDAGFDEWLLQGGEAHAPLYAGYESQIIQKVNQYKGNAAALKLLSQQVRILYPEPTVYSDHPIIALDGAASHFIDAMADHDIQAIAWKSYGFRSGTELGLNSVTDFPQLPLAEQLKTTTPPSAAVTQLLLNCIRNNQCG